MREHFVAAVVRGAVVVEHAAVVQVGGPVVAQVVRGVKVKGRAKVRDPAKDFVAKFELLTDSR